VDEIQTVVHITSCVSIDRITTDHKPPSLTLLIKLVKHKFSLKLLNSVLSLVFCIGVATADFHKSGKLPDLMLKLSFCQFIIHNAFRPH